jgi:tyrosinase
MSHEEHDSRSCSRRDFLASAGAAAVALNSASCLRAQAPPSLITPKYRRLNLSDRAAEKSLKSYEKAVTAMLALPPSDPRNWYRHALIHTLDCPHGNWWFLPWHRGYTGWFEKICRELSGDADFALPYWDWTESPRLPDAFLQGNLNPANFKIAGVAEFKNQYQAIVKDYWSTLDSVQLTQLTLRDFPSDDVLWAYIEHDPPGNPNEASMFSDISYVRELNPPRSPWLNDKASRAVALTTILDALGPRTFEEFGSGKLSYHTSPDSATQGVLEGQPHNLVHNELGGIVTGLPDRQGFMRDFLSPVDPIFFMHHTNIDRLWDVWTRKQLITGQQQQHPERYPTVPESPEDLAAWTNEPFLFFIGPDGRPVAQRKAGDYVSSAAFDYDYQPGSGEIVVPKTAAPLLAQAEETLKGTILQRRSAAVNQATASVKITDALSRAASPESGVRFIAKITAELPPNSRDVQVHVLVNAPAEAKNVSFTDPSYAGTFQQFGGHHGGKEHEAHSVTFSVGLTSSVQRLAAQKRFAADSMTVSVVTDRPGVALRSSTVRLVNVSVSLNQLGR